MPPLHELKKLEPLVDLARLGVFATFVALGLAVARAARERRRVDVLLAYVLAVTTVVGLTQQESWPFTQWALVAGASPRHMVMLEVEALDGSGRPYVVDLRVLQPLSPEEFASWLRFHLPRLGGAERDALGRFLLERSEAGRRRLLAGEPVAPNQWLLGALAAPYHFHDARTWTSAAQVPSTPFASVRAYFVEWDVEQRVLQPGQTLRRLLFEHRGHAS